MRRQDQMGALRDIQILPVIHPECRYGLAFFFQGNGIEYDSVTNQVDGAFMEDPRRDLMQNDLLVIDVQGMACIGTTLEPGYQVVAGSKIIYNLSFSFIPPLEA